MASARHRAEVRRKTGADLIVDRKAVTDLSNDAVLLRELSRPRPPRRPNELCFSSAFKRRDGLEEITVEDGPLLANCRPYCGVALWLVRSQMEDAMCYAKDYKFFDNQKKAEDTEVVQRRRAGLIDRLLNAANRHGEKTEAQKTPVKEVAPAK